MHPGIFDAADNVSLDERFVINASHYPDIQDLYIISNFLITDYSSVIFDFMLLERRAAFYAVSSSCLLRSAKIMMRRKI